MAMYFPSFAWSDPIEFDGPALLAVNSGEIALVFSSEPNDLEDGIILEGGQRLRFGYIPGQYVRIRRTSNRRASVYIGPWWS